MKEITENMIVSSLSAVIDYSLKHVDEKVIQLIKKALENETQPLSIWALEQIIRNSEIAANQNCYACQDCGLAVVFAQVGNDLHLACDLNTAINKAVEKGYINARKSVADPLTRLNTKTNTPCIIHTTMVEGDTLKLTYLAKGAGSENMGALYMLTPSKGRQGIIDSVVDCVRKAGANPCPPIIVGVGIGGTMEQACILAKHSLTLPIDSVNQREDERLLAKEILEKVNALHIGPQGFGGNTTALAVKLETFPTHIGMLPVAVNIQCHSVRHGSVEL